MSPKVRRGCLVASVAVFVALVAPGPSSASTTLDAAKACRKALSTKSGTYTDKRLKLLLRCADKLLRCEIELEVDGTNPNTCRSRAKDSCTRTIGPAVDSALNRAAARFDDKAGQACLAFGVAAMKSNLSGGLWFANDTTCGASPDLPTLLDCLRGEFDLEVDALVGRTAPRTGLLLDNIGLGGGFPNITRPPSTVVPALTATAPGSGDLVNPGTITSAAGNAVKFTGDSTTLPCGGGQNGKVTISISTAADPCTDPTAQQHVLKEPYGPTVVAVFGPFTIDQNYCLELKDSSCSDTETGLIDIP